MTFILHFIFHLFFHKPPPTKKMSSSQKLNRIELTTKFPSTAFLPVPCVLLNACCIEMSWRTEISRKGSLVSGADVDCGRGCECLAAGRNCCYTKGSFTSKGDSFTFSGFLGKMFLGRILLRHLLVTIITSSLYRNSLFDGVN